MAGDEDHALADELVRQRDRLLAVAGVVADDHPDLLAEDPAVGVELRHRELGGLAELILPGYRHPAGLHLHEPDPDLRARRRSADRHDEQPGHQHAGHHRSAHRQLPFLAAAVRFTSKA